MSKNVPLIIKQITGLIGPVLDDIGFELVDLEYLSKHGRWVLRLYIDKDGGVTIDDCARVSREIADLIDVKDIIEHEYVLEVSSPGVNRPLKKNRDFILAIGKKIKVKMVTPVEGQRNFTGNLKNFQERTIYLETEGKLVTLPLPEVDKANLIFEF